MRIVATDPVPPVAHETFATLGEIVVGEHELDEAEILIVRSGRVDAALLDRAPSLRVIARTGAGVDNVDVPEASRRGIPVLYAPRVGSRPVAEGAVALILATAKRLGELGAVVRTGSWACRYDTPGLDLDGASLGLVGVGHIGAEVARLCRGLGMRVLGADPALEPSAATQIELVSLPELVARADVISLHCALDKRTRGLVDRDLLARVRPGAILVNAARGGVVESEEVLAEALEAGRLSAIALDVFPSEPPDTSHRLYSDPRVICTPHAIGLTQNWNAAVFAALARGVESVLGGGTAENVLNPEALVRAHAGAAGD